MALENDAQELGFTIARVAEPLGAEVVGLDLSQPLSDATFAVLREALQTHHLLCFRDQTDLSNEDHLAFTERWGELEVFPEADKTKAANTIYNVANVTPDGVHVSEEDNISVYQKVNARWHTDSSYRYIPSFASIMLGIEVMPEGADGGETEFSNMLLAYDALPADLKARIEPLHMVHYYEFGRRIFPQLPPVTAFERNAVPPTCHPLVRVHPDRDYRRSLFFTTNAGNEVSGMDLEEGQALHRQLAQHANDERFTYLHSWKPWDLVMWDNRVLLHRARPYDMNRYRRVFRRTTVAGSGPILGPYSTAVKEAGR